MPPQIIQGLKKRSSYFVSVVLVMVSLDWMVNFFTHFVNVYFMLECEEYKSKWIYAIVEVIFFTILITCVIILVLKRKKNRVIFVSCTYLVLGLLLFCYILINGLKEEGNSEMSRPKEYYMYHLDQIVFWLVISTSFLRITGSIMMFLLAYNINKIDEVIQSQLLEQVEQENTDDRVNSAINRHSHADRLSTPHSYSISYKKEAINRSTESSIEKFEKPIESFKEEPNCFSIPSETNFKDRQVNMNMYYKRIVKET